MKKFTISRVVLSALFLALKGAAGHPICYYSSVSLENATKENKCRKFCANYKSKTTGQCFAYLFDSQSGWCTGFVLDHRSKYVDYAHCGANYGAKLDFETDDEFPDGLYEYQDLQHVIDDYYDSAAKENENDYYDAYYSSVDETDKQRCDFKSVTLGVASTKKICKELCTSCMDPWSRLSAVDLAFVFVVREENSSELYGGCAAWFWNPDNEECEGLLSQKGDYGYDTCGTVQKKPQD